MKVKAEEGKLSQCRGSSWWEGVLSRRKGRDKGWGVGKGMQWPELGREPGAAVGAGA